MNRPTGNESEPNSNDRDIKPESATAGCPIDYRCLSLWRPWPWTILHHPTDPKRIENRGHNRFRRFRGWLLLHAAQKWDRDCYKWCDARGLLPNVDGLQYMAMRYMREPRASYAREGWHPTGIVGRCRVVGDVDEMGCYTNDDRWPDGETVGWDIRDADSGLDTRWWMGGHGLLLAGVEALDRAIPCRGRQGLWCPPADVVAQLPDGWRHD